MEKKNTIIIGRKRIPDMKFLELRQKDVINCNTGECLGFVLDLEFEIHTGKICYLIVPKTTKMLICVGKNKVYKIPYKCIVVFCRSGIYDSGILTSTIWASHLLVPPCFYCLKYIIFSVEKKAFLLFQAFFFVDID